MTRMTSKTFDCVQGMRKTRDRLRAEIADKSYEDLVRWLRSHRYADLFLQRLAEEAAHEALQPTPAKGAGAAERHHVRRTLEPWNYGLAPRDDSDEGISHNHRHGFWLDHSGSYLACPRGGAAPGDGPLVSSPHRRGRRSMFLGVELA